MKKDRFLIGILIGIAVLVVVALVLAFTRQGTKTYVSEDTPEGVLHNFVMALHNNEYQRAYGYLVEADDKPNYDEFRQAFLRERSDTLQTDLIIGEIELQGDDEAYIHVTIIHAGSGPFDELYHETATASLTRQSGEWKITNLPYPYWRWEWYKD